MPNPNDNEDVQNAILKMMSMMNTMKTAKGMEAKGEDPGAFLASPNGFGSERPAESVPSPIDLMGMGGMVKGAMPARRIPEYMRRMGPLPPAGPEITAAERAASEAAKDSAFAAAQRAQGPALSESLPPMPPMGPVTKTPGAVRVDANGNSLAPGVWRGEKLPGNSTIPGRGRR